MVSRADESSACDGSTPRVCVTFASNGQGTKFIMESEPVRDWHRLESGWCVTAWISSIPALRQNMGSVKMCYGKTCKGFIIYFLV